MEDEKKVKITDIKDYFGYTDSAKFIADWRALTDADRAELKAALAELS